MNHLPPRQPRKRPRWQKDPKSARLLDRAGAFLLGFGAFAVIQAIVRPPAESPSTQTRSPQTAEEQPSGWYSPPAPEAQTQARVQTPQPLATVDVSEATICVQGTLPNGTEVCASGVSIDPQLVGIDPGEGSVVVTNFHVILNTGNEPPVRLGNDGDWYSSEILKRSPDMDLALLYVPDVRLPVAALAEASPEGQIPVRAIGFPNNQPLTVRDSTLLGKIQECLAVAPCLALQSGTITHGNSGGPLEADGVVIGINQGETIREIAIPIEQVHYFLSDAVEDSDIVPPQYQRAMPPPGMPPMYPAPRRPLPPPPYGGYPPPRRWR
jgi:S1-C subfamily serine protease